MKSEGVCMFVRERSGVRQWGVTGTGREGTLVHLEVVFSLAIGFPRWIDTNDTPF